MRWPSLHERTRLHARPPLHESCQSSIRAEARDWAVNCAERAAGSWAGVSEVEQLRLKMGWSGLPPDGQDHAKTRLAAHHALVGLGGALEREGLVHRPHPGARAEDERLLRVDRRPRVPPLDRAPSGEKQDRGDLQRGGRPDDHERAVDRQPALHGADRLAAGRRRQDDRGTAELLELRRRTLGLAVDVPRRPEPAGVRLLVLAARDADRVEAHPGGILHREMAQPAEAEHGHDVPRPRTAVAQRVEGRQAGAHQRRRLDGIETRRHPRHGAGGGDQVLSVTTVVGDAGHLTGHTREEVSAPAVVAASVVPAVPPHAGRLSLLPSDHAGADRVDRPRHLVSLFFFNDTAPTEIYTLSLHDALPISKTTVPRLSCMRSSMRTTGPRPPPRSEEHTSELQSHVNLVCRLLLEKKKR